MEQGFKFGAELHKSLQGSAERSEHASDGEDENESDEKPSLVGSEPMIMRKEEYEAVMQKTCHLVLKRKYYDQIEGGRKVVEYRDNTEYWRRRIIPAKYVVFHRGYTKTTMKWKIHKIKTNGQIEIHLGVRVA